MTEDQEKIQETITETFRASDTVLDEEGGWYHAQRQFHEFMDRTERELNWPVTVEIQISAVETND